MLTKQVEVTAEFSLSKLYRFAITILGRDSGFYWLAMLYGIGISVLFLATPVSVQILVNTVANTGVMTQLFLLTFCLFVFLLLSALLNALRIQLMDVFQRKFYSRMVSEISLSALFAANPFFQDEHQGGLFNRYFDIVIVQKNLPNLLVSGFTIFLQSVVGFVLVSMYHPLFLMFNLIVALIIWIIWTAWGRRAIRSAVMVSHKKHEMATWLQSLGQSNGFFKTDATIDEALRMTDYMTRQYIDKHVHHFRHHFAQTVGFLLLYAVSSAALLGLGGWLVINGELTLGQLVAAELVLSAAFYGVSYLGIYLAYFYELCAAVDELSLFLNVEQEDLSGDIDVFDGDSRLKFVACRGNEHGMTHRIDIETKKGARVMAVAETPAVQREFCNLLKRHIRPKAGYITLGGVDISSLYATTLRKQIRVIDRPSTVDMTVREYLRLNSSEPGSEKDLELLRLVGLEQVLMSLDDGLDTRLATTGWPLTTTETFLLKLAAAIIATPRILVLSQLFDVMPTEQIARALDYLQSKTDCTVIYFSSRDQDLGFDTYLYLGTDKQEIYPTFEAMRAVVGEEALRNQA